MKKRGGKRPGAGRPPGPPSKSEGILMSLDGWAMLDEVRSETGESKGALVERLIRAEHEKIFQKFRERG